LQNSPLESSCVVVALIENYRTSKPLNVSPEKLEIFICDTVVAIERYQNGSTEVCYSDLKHIGYAGSTAA
jgi:hypothetical protein